MSDWSSVPPIHKVIHIFAAHAVSHLGVGSQPYRLFFFQWTRHGTEDFLVHRQGGKGWQSSSGCHCLNPDGWLVQWSLVLIPQPNETTAIARTRVTYGNFHKKRPFSCVGEFCLLTRCLLMG